VRSFVAGPALASLDENGHFVLPGPTDPWPYPVIAASTATEIARGVINTWYANPDVHTIPGAISLVEGAEEQHGGPIDWQHLVAAPRAFYTESHLEPLDSSVGTPTIRHFGPQYLVVMLEDGEPTVTVAVSLHAVNIWLRPGGFVARTDPLDGGGEFNVSGIPLSLAIDGYPPTPELAVKFAYEQTGVQIGGVPSLGRPGNHIAASAARWRLELVEPAKFVRLIDGAVVESAIVYVGTAPISVDLRFDPGWKAPPLGLRLFIAAEQQPASEVVGVHTATIRPGYAVDLHEVQAVR